MEPDQLKSAYETGVKAGDHDTTPGNLFRGAFAAADQCGYTNADPIPFGVFVGGYLAGIQECDTGGIIVDEFNIVQENR